ncbi:MAG: hypothetical protein KGJ84_05140 [Elusimicrobia bacterium]|nr:hypothetical protein [Elusimicrobiota bacterium]
MRCKVLAALVIGLFLSAPALAEPDDDGWTEFKAPQATGTVAAPTTSEGGFSAPDRQSFSDNLHAKVLEQICRQLKLDQSFDLGSGDFSGTSVGVQRYLGTYPDNTFALVDVERLTASLSHGFSRVLGPDGTSAGISLSASIEGDSMVVRRLNTKESCDGLKRIANLRDVKTVMPVSAKRLAEMQLGELWRVPFTLTYGQGVSAAAARSGAEAAGGVSVSFGRSDAGTASMTLYRIADDKLRFRFRIDHVVVHSESLNLTETFPAVAYAGNASNILMKFVDKEVANQVARYSSLMLGYGRSSSDGARIVMEFVVDPRDPAQAEAMAKAVKGDIMALVKMAVKMSTFQAGDAKTLQDYESLRDEHAKSLRDSTYSASDEYKAKIRSFAFSLPFFVSHNSSKLLGDDRVTRYTGDEGEFHYYRSDKSASNSYIDAPFVGALVKESSQRDAEVVTYAPKGGTHADPILVYIRNQGYVRVPASSVRGTIREMNGILKLVGAQRGAAEGRFGLPTDKLVPPSPPLPQSAREADGTTEPSDRKGMISLTLAFNQKAVRDMLAASTDQVLRAFSASLGAAHMGIIDGTDKPLMDWLIANGKYKDGKISYDPRAADRAFPSEEPGRGDEDKARSLSNLSEKAAGLLADLAAARGAKDNVARAAEIAKIVGGRGESGLAYEDVLRVLVQLVDPLDVTGDFVAGIQATSKGVNNTNAHLVLKNGRKEVPMLKDAGETKSRFAQPSVLTD